MAGEIRLGRAEEFGLVTLDNFIPQDYLDLVIQVDNKVSQALLQLECVFLHKYLNKIYFITHIFSSTKYL